MLLLFSLMVASLYLLGSNRDFGDNSDRYHLVLLMANVTALLLFGLLIIMNAINLYRDVRVGVEGSRLTLRLVIIFVLVAMVPVGIMYFFSVKFLRDGIDSYFDVNIEQGLEDSLSLSRGALSLQMRAQIREVQRMALELTDIPSDAAVLVLNDLLGASETAELTLLNQSNEILATSGTLDMTNVIPTRPDVLMIDQVSRGSPYVGIDNSSRFGLVIQVLVKIPNTFSIGEKRLLHAVYPVDESQAILAEHVEEAVQAYQQMVFLRAPLKWSFVITLTLVLLMTVLMAVWVAFVAARWLFKPLRDLASGTRAVATGDYNVQLPVSGRDEMGSVVKSFNSMTARLAYMQKQNASGQAQLARQSQYVQAVLSQLSSGVVTVTRNGVLRTSNHAAEDILNIDIAQHIGEHYSHLDDDHDSPALQFWRAIDQMLESGKPTWQTEVEISDERGRRVIVCRGARLSTTGEGHYALVFDEVTQMIRAQREAAWREVARRLAHEIKNPLTPIQLSAERLRRRYLKSMSEEEGEMLDRATNTIVAQVDSMKSMVNAFAEYANSTEPSFSMLALNTLIRDVAELYQGMNSITVTMALDKQLPKIRGDSLKLRQLIHNLIKNASEAKGSSNQVTDNDEPVIITIATSLDITGESKIELTITDTGPGFPVEMIDRLFEPYVTSKPRGTGLGLAVVKQIVDEHGGNIIASNSPNSGACITVQLPINGDDGP